MPAGLPYFAWIDASETTFTAGHLRWDESVFSFTLSQEEGDPASLSVMVRRPRNVAGDPIGLLGPGRKIWCWFALDCGPDLIRFRGRLVGIPTSLFEDLVTLEFVARPIDVVAQKEALANTLRVLPYYDAAVIEPSRRNDPDLVLEGYTKIWHFDRETHVVTVSDEISGEDGLVTFLCANGDVLYDGLGLNLTSGPLTRVDVAAEFTWTQRGYGSVDITRYLVSHWPGASRTTIFSFSMSAQDWPKTGAGIGEGWIALRGGARNSFNLTETYTETFGGTTIVEGPTGDEQGRAQQTMTTTTPTAQTLFVPGPEYTYNSSWQASYDDDGDVSSVSANSSTSESMYAMQGITPTLVAGWKAERQCTERVSFSLFADVQPILTDPEDGEALRIDDVRSINLSEEIDGDVPIGNPLRRSYIATERGNRSLEHLIALARAHLMKRARVVEIKFEPKLSRMPEVTLRKDALLNEPRIGEATGKIIGYSIALDGSDGRIKCEIRIGCVIGRGGTVAATDGTPTYCDISYAGSDYQVFINRTVLLPADTSVGYGPPIAAPNDDGLDLLFPLRPEEIFEQPLSVQFGHQEQENHLREELAAWGDTGVQAGDAGGLSGFQARTKAMQGIAEKAETRATFKLKSMTREFSTDYEIQVTDLKIPTGYDLEAV